MNTTWIVILIIVAVIIGVFVGLYFLGKKLQTRQEELKLR